MKTIKDDITGEVFYRIGNSRVINADTPIVRGGINKDVIPYFVKKFGFIELNGYTEYVLSVCAYACPIIHELEYYIDSLKDVNSDVPAIRILHDMLYNKDSEVLTEITDKYLNYDDSDSTSIPMIRRLPPTNPEWSVGGFTIDGVKYIRIGTRLIPTNSQYLYVPSIEVYTAVRDMVGLSKYGEETLYENEAICFIAGMCPYEMVTAKHVYEYIKHVKTVEKTYGEYYPSTLKKLIRILDNKVLPYRGLSDIVNKHVSIKLRVVYAMFGQVAHSQFELGIIQDIQSLQIRDPDISMTTFFNNLLKDEDLSVCKKSFLLNVMLGPIATGGKLPKRFMNINKNLRDVEGVIDMDFQSKLSYEELDELHHMHTGLIRSATYRGMVAFMFDKELKKKYPTEHIEIVNSIKELTSAFVCSTTDDVYKLLGLGLNPIPILRPKNIEFDILCKENNWSYVHGCLYNYLKDGGEIDLTECDEKIVFDESSARLVIAVIGFSTGITSVKLYRWLFSLVHEYVAKYCRGEGVDAGVGRWIAHLNKNINKREELLYWIFRYKEESPMIVDSYVQNLSEKSEV